MNNDIIISEECANLLDKIALSEEISLFTLREIGFDRAEAMAFIEETGLSLSNEDERKIRRLIGGGPLIRDTNKPAAEPTPSPSTEKSILGTAAVAVIIDTAAVILTAASAIFGLGKLLHGSSGTSAESSPLQGRPKRPEQRYDEKTSPEARGDIHDTRL